MSRLRRAKAYVQIGSQNKMTLSGRIEREGT